MPRAVTPPYAYILPAVYLAIPGTTILVDQHNTPLEDIANTFNQATPIQYGGTAATTVAGAQANLGISPADQLTYPTATGTANTLIVANTTPILVLANRTPASFKAGASANTAAATVNFDSLGAKPIRKIVGGTDVDVAANDIAAGGLYQVEYFTAANTGTGAWVLAPTVITTNPALTSNANFGNFAIGTPSVAANALTIPFNGLDGNAFSASNSAFINFRSATAGSGAIAQLPITSAQSIVIPSGATLGLLSGIIGKIWIFAANDGGTLRFGVINCLSGTSILGLRDGLYSSTQLSGSSTAAQTLYTVGAAITAKAITILGYVELTEATAGAYATAPSLAFVRTASMALPGDTVQSQRTATGAMSTGTTNIPNDDTIPQITEGDQFMSQAITPISGANLLRLTSEGQYSQASTSAYISSALFRDATANALAAVSIFSQTVNGIVQAVLNHTVLAGSTTATTLRLRAGTGSSVTLTFNGVNGARYFGGVMSSYIQVDELVT